MTENATRTCECEDTCNLCQGWYGPGYTCDCRREVGHYDHYEDDE